MTKSEGYSAQMVGQKAGEKHSHDNPYALVVLPLSAGRADELLAGFVDVPGDGDVAAYQHHQHHHEHAGVDVDDGRVPLDPQGRLQLEAVVDVPPGGVAVGEDEVGQRQEGHHHPHAGGQHLGEGDAVHARVPEGLHHLEVAVDADEAQEGDGGVHVGVEQHRAVPAQEGVEVPRAQPRVTDDLERERQRHQQVRHHDVLQVEDEAGLVPDVEEDPHGQAIEQEAGQEDDEVQHGQDDGGELVVSRVPGGAGVGRAAVVGAEVIVCENKGKQRVKAFCALEMGPIEVIACENEGKQRVKSFCVLQMGPDEGIVCGNEGKQWVKAFCALQMGPV